MLAEIFGDGDVAAGEQALRGFAHEVIDRQRADSARRKAESGLSGAQWRQRDTEKLIRRSGDESRRLSIASEEHRNRAAQNEGQLSALQAKLEQARAEFGDDALETMTARQTLTDVQAEAKDLRAMANEEDEAAKAYAAKVQQLKEQLTKQQAAVREAEAGAAVERAHAESVARRTAESGYSVLDGTDERASSVALGDQDNTKQV